MANATPERCPDCEDVKYCSAECQHRPPLPPTPVQDLQGLPGAPAVQERIRFRFTTFSKSAKRNQPDMVRALYFPVDEEQPKWVWMPAELCNDKSEQDLKEYLGYAAGDKLKWEGMRKPQ
ncbi:hypothetical protein LTR08_000186 [Meristemomyces frigidus]|nr:hypothetical protein LTR08_000186 [Meristemomyces frigidus]